MSQYNSMKARKAVALKYNENDIAPIIVASGAGQVAEKMVEVANESGVPVYEDTSLTSVLSQLELGSSVPEELYRAVVDIYVFFLNFSPRRQTEPADTEKKAEDGKRGI